MAAPSIQSFFRKTSGIDAGFTASELSTSNPLSRAWNPPADSARVNISDIVQGKNQVHFSGRIVNFRPATIDKHSSQYLSSWHYIIVKDDSGAIGVKLRPLGIPATTFSLGQLVSVWATYVCEPPANQHSVPYVMTSTAITPKPGSRQFLRIESETPESWLLYRVPLDCGSEQLGSQSLQGLVTLASYIKSGHDDVRGLRVLVCVRSVGARKRIRPHGRDSDVELQEVVVFDHTASCVLSLWETQTNSSMSWTADSTILLLTSPKWKSWNRQPDPASQAKGSIAIDHKTLVEVNPDFQDATWLRKWAEDRTKKEAVVTQFPADLWDVDGAMHGPVRTLFTIAEVEEYARGDPDLTFTGKLNLLVLSTNLADLWFKKAFCCTDCCGVPLLANSHSALCRHCQTHRNLSINPRIVGTMADETGCVERGKLMWNPRAWMELLFPGAVTTTRTTDESTTITDGSRLQEVEESVTKQIVERISAQGLQSVREAEDKLQEERITLTFGWSGEVGRLCVLGVEW